MTSRQTNSAPAGPASAIGTEQAYVDMLYGLLDRARDRAAVALAGAHASGGAGGTFQARMERDITAAEQARRLAQLNAVEHGLVFGRTDGHDSGSANGDPGPDPEGPHPQGPPPQGPHPECHDTQENAPLGHRERDHAARRNDRPAPPPRPAKPATPKDPHRHEPER
jgi:hypothetical protein